MYLCMRYVGTYLLYIGTYLFILGLVGVDCLPACPFFLLAPSHIECVGDLCVCGLCVSVAGGGLMVMKDWRDIWIMAVLCAFPLPVHRPSDNP